MQCSFECDEPVLRRDNQAATQLYRITQEATTNAASAPGMGLQTMNDRAGILGGTLLNTSGNGPGTVVRYTIPGTALVKRESESATTTVNHET